MRGEAIVIGGGPAGLSASLGLAGAGVTVTLLEQRSEWVGRVCGAFVNPEGVSHLGALGALEEIRRAGGVAVSRSRVTATGRLDRMVDVTVQGTPGLGVPRKILEETMIGMAREAGVDVRMGRRAVAIERQGDGWAVVARCGQSLERHVADLVVVSDGRFSLGEKRLTRRRVGWIGWNATFAGVRQAPGELSMHFFPFGYFGALTFADGSTNVCGLTSLPGDQAHSWDERWCAVVSAQPHLARLMKDTERVSPWQGVGPLPFTSSMRRSTGAVLGGDAAAVGDPYMGEGISRALGTGPILREVVAAQGDGRLGADVVRPAYEEEWRRRYAPRLRLGAAARRLQVHPRLFHGVLGLLLRRPRLTRSVTRVFHPAMTS